VRARSHARPIRARESAAPLKRRLGLRDDGQEREARLALGDVADEERRLAALADLRRLTMHLVEDREAEVAGGPRGPETGVGRDDELRGVETEVLDRRVSPLVGDSLIGDDNQRPGRAELLDGAERHVRLPRAGAVPEEEAALAARVGVGDQPDVVLVGPDEDAGEGRMERGRRRGRLYPSECFSIQSR
jgi:hypothetical protein